MQSAYEKLPVFKAALDLAVYFEKLVRNFDRGDKYSIGADLRNISRQILMLVARANSSEHRIGCLNVAIEQLEELKIVIRICKELSTFNSFNNYEAATKLTLGVLRQCEGWKKSQSSSGQKA